MLGTRGVRLGILYPAIYAMQVEAILRALVAARERRASTCTRRSWCPWSTTARELSCCAS